MVCSACCRSQPAVAVKAKEAAASLYMQLGWVHLLRQSQEAGMLPGLQQPEAALHCFQQAAARVQAFGENLILHICINTHCTADAVKSG